MAKRTPVTEEPLAAGGATATPWAEARERLANPEQARTYWLATVRPDGRPHLMPLLGLWLDGAFYFVTGERTRKGTNLADDPRCAIATSSTTLPSLDVVLEGEARKVTGEAELRRVADAYGAKMDWPLDVRDGGVFGENAPTAGPPPYTVFALTPATVFGLPGLAGMGEAGGPDPFSPTRWRFSTAAATSAD
jgi:nitroimidazol reductase NimA-like FMN-containing flavoprotein (pyridoxamine 5'-phosphate oxidase superfamily)